MTYVMSDLHGTYRKYLKMLNLINFSSKDTLYILGDVCDRGDDSAKLYLDIMSRDNVFCIKGNHECMLEQSLPSVFDWLCDYADAQMLKGADPELWVINGGDKTIVSLMDLENNEDVCRIYSFVRRLPYYRQIKVGEKLFTLVHAGGFDVRKKKDISKFSQRELVWKTPDYNAVFGRRDKDILIVGHTPTPLLCRSKRARIYFGKGNIIDVDCGAVFAEAGGRLGCLCLDNMYDYYV